MITAVISIFIFKVIDPLSDVKTLSSSVML